MRKLLAVQVLLPLVFFVELQHVVGRSSLKLVLQEITKARFDENIKVETDLKIERKDSGEISDVSVKPTKSLQGDLTCDCSNYCLDPDSSELEVGRDANYNSR